MLQAQIATFSELKVLIKQSRASPDIYFFIMFAISGVNSIFLPFFPSKNSRKIYTYSFFFRFLLLKQRKKSKKMLEKLMSTIK